MRKILLLLPVLMLLACHNTHSQEHEAFFQHQVDFLNQVQPKEYKSLRPRGCLYTIIINDQYQFDRMLELIIGAIDAGYKNIKVQISQGQYQFKPNHITFIDASYEEVSISIEGDGVIITSDKDFSKAHSSITPWHELEYADDVVRILDENEKLCFLPVSNAFSESDRANYTKVQITQWFRAPVYDVTRIDDKGIYFIAPDLRSIKKFVNISYSVNYDYLYTSKAPRFRLFDNRLLRNCSASNFLKIERSSFQSFTMKGLEFCSNKSGPALLSLSDVRTSQIIIKECKFDCIRGSVFCVTKTDNVEFDHNAITNTSGNEVIIAGGCHNVRITHNEFKDCGLGLGNMRCIDCSESEYYIADNTICNFSYCAICVGLWYGHDCHYETKGIIEHNEINFSSDYFANKEKHTLMDGGAIYVCTINDNAIIRFNFIHDYAGMHSYSGIYCDDGASNCKMYGNVILNIPDGYSITSRRVKDVRSDFHNNANNFMAYNIFDGDVEFCGYGTEERHCQKGMNFTLHSKRYQRRKTRYVDLEIKIDDIIVESYQFNQGVLTMPKPYITLFKDVIKDQKINNILK